MDTCAINLASVSEDVDTVCTIANGKLANNKFYGHHADKSTGKTLSLFSYKGENITEAESFPGCIILTERRHSPGCPGAMAAGVIWWSIVVF